MLSSSLNKTFPSAIVTGCQDSVIVVRDVLEASEREKGVLWPHIGVHSGIGWMFITCSGWQPVLEHKLSAQAEVK